MTETIVKTVEVVADSYGAAEIKALETDMSTPDTDSDIVEANLVEIKEVPMVGKFPLEINGWKLAYPDVTDPFYVKDFGRGKGYTALCLMWLDTVRGDEGYNADGDVWTIIEADGNTAEDALEALDIMPFSISDVGRRVEVEEMLLNYIRNR